MVAAPSEFYDRGDRFWGPFSLPLFLEIGLNDHHQVLGRHSSLSCSFDPIIHETRRQAYVSYTEQMTRSTTDDSQRRLLKYEMTTRGCDGPK